MPVLKHVIEASLVRIIFFTMSIIPTTVVMIIVISLLFVVVYFSVLRFIQDCPVLLGMYRSSTIMLLIRCITFIQHSFLAAYSLLIYHMSQYRSWCTPCSATRCHRNTSYSLRYQSDGRHLQIYDDLWLCWDVSIVYVYVLSQLSILFHLYIYVQKFYCLHVYMLFRYTYFYLCTYTHIYI